MFWLKTKNKYAKYRFFLQLFSFSIFIPWMIFFIITSLLYISNSTIVNIQFFKLMNIINIFVIPSLGILFFLINTFLKRLLFKKLYFEHANIVSKVKMPNKLPKVIYVYTTHNDFMPSRLLQNMQQTYKNIEYWISDGSSNEDVSKEIAEFAQKHNVNLFKMDKPSKDKSDNLNTFLSFAYKNNLDFEYIVTGDSDVAFGENFIEKGIKYFYTKQLNRLGWVNSFLIDYKGNNFYNSILANIETFTNVYGAMEEQIAELASPHMYGACSIVKKEFLLDINNGFFCDLYEDWYTRTLGIKNLWRGICSPLVLSMQSMENEVFPTLRRYMRYFDWKAKYFKTKMFNQYNDEFEKPMMGEFFDVMLYFPRVLFYILLCCLNVFLLIVSLHNYFVPFILFSFVLIQKVFTWIFSFHLIGIKRSIVAIIFAPFWFFAHSYKKSQHWFKSVLGNKIMEFKPTRSKEKNVIKPNVWDKTKNYFFGLLISTTILLAMNFPIIYFGLEHNKFILFFFLLGNALFGYIFLGNFSVLMLFLLSKIKTSKTYSDENFVSFKKTKLIFEKWNTKIN